MFPPVGPLPFAQHCPTARGLRANESPFGPRCLRPLSVSAVDSRAHAIGADHRRIVRNRTRFGPRSSRGRVRPDARRAPPGAPRGGGERARRLRPARQSRRPGRVRARRRGARRTARRHGRPRQLRRHRYRRIVRGPGHEANRAPGRREPDGDAGRDARVAPAPAKVARARDHSGVDRRDDSDARPRRLRRDEGRAHRLDVVAEPRGVRPRRPCDRDLPRVRRDADDGVDRASRGGADLDRRRRHPRPRRPRARTDGPGPEHR